MRTSILRAVAAAVLAAWCGAGALLAGSLKGRVLDPQGAAVAQARLRLFDRNSGELRETRSRDDGTYSFVSVPNGAYLLAGDAANMALAGAREATVSGAQTQDLTLAVSGTRTVVVVTASGTPLAEREVGKSLDVVESGEIALRNEFALSEAIRNLPGLRVQQLRGPGSFTSVQTRGLRNHDTAVLIDGLRFRDAASVQGDATAFFEAMNLVNAERVEVLRGSGSSLYGSHAVGGVINVSSRQGGGRQHGELRAEGGGLGLLRGVGRFGGGLGANRFVYSGGLSHLNVTRGYRDASPHRNTSAHGFAKQALAPNLSLSGRAWAADTFLALTESPAFPEGIVANFPASGPVPARALPVRELERFEQGRAFDPGSATFMPAQLDPDGRRGARFSSVAVSLHHQVTPGSSYRLAYQIADTRRVYRDGPAGPGSYEPAVSNQSRFEGGIQTFQARGDHRLGGSNLVSWGYEAEGERYFNLNSDERPMGAEDRTEIDQASHALFAQDQLRFLDGNLHVSVAGRAQFFALGTPSFLGEEGPYAGTASRSPRNALTGDVSAAYFVRGSQTKLRAHAGNSFRAPSAYERFGGSFSSFSGGFNYWGDPSLAPERAVAADAGIDQWLAGSRVRLSGTFFYTNLQETIRFDFANFPSDDAFGRFGGFRNAGGGIARGAEFGARFSPAAGSAFQTAYTYTNSDSRAPTIGSDFFQIPGLSEHVVTLTATQWIAERFNLTFDLFAVSDYTLSPYGAQGRHLVFDGPFKADLAFRYEVPFAEGRRLEFYGKAENVFNNEYYEDGFGSPGVWVIGGIRFSY